MPRRSEDMPGFLIRTPAGPIFKNDYVYFTKRVACGGWLTVRSVDAGGRWVNGIDHKGKTRSIRPELITRITRKTVLA